MKHCIHILHMLINIKGKLVNHKIIDDQHIFPSSQFFLNMTILDNNFISSLLASNP